MIAEDVFKWLSDRSRAASQVGRARGLDCRVSGLGFRL